MEKKPKKTIGEKNKERGARGNIARWSTAEYGNVSPPRKFSWEIEA